MIIRQLELENIRSYRRMKVEFPLGKTLFEGDVGSGKSTLLMAIEFALFGFGTEAGGSMLRAGTSRGRVNMVFEVDGKTYRIERGLVKKGRSIQQTGGTLVTPEGELDLSASEMKEKILEILQFNEAPDPKAQSWIYRYAVYTPQEEMKAVLWLSPDLRLQILRRAFRLEDYKVAVDNATNLIREIEKRADEFEVLSRGIRDLKEKIREIEEKRSAYSRILTETERKEKEIETELEELKMKRELLREQELGLKATEDEIRLHEKIATERERSALEENTIAGELIERIKIFERRLEEWKQFEPPSNMTASQLEEEAGRLLRKIEELTALNERLASKAEDYRKILEKGRCPVCDRQVDPHEFLEKEKSKRQEQSHVAHELDEVKAEERRIRKLLADMREYEAREKEIGGVSLELERYRDELVRRKERAGKYEEEARKARAKVQELYTKMASLAGLSEKVGKTVREIESAETRLKETRDLVSKVTEDIEFTKKQQEELEEEIAGKEEAAKRRDELQEYLSWLADYFVPTMQLIEKSVMQSLNQEFGLLFQRWFSALVDDPSKEARIDESFTPIVSQEGYEQDIYYLSGGEKTSVSLAYRLALNSLVRRVCSVKPNVMILDEPTDGFSKEQLGNVREVLDEVGCPQVIVVSHEKELESFADQIYRIIKDKGESRILMEGV